MISGIAVVVAQCVTGCEVGEVGGRVKLRGSRCVDDVAEQHSDVAMRGTSGGGYLVGRLRIRVSVSRR